MITDKIVIPLLKAAISGLLLALFVAALYGVSQGVTLWRMFWLVLSGCILAPWLILILPRPERLPVLKPKETTVRLELASDNGRRLQFADLPVGYDTLTQFAQGVIHGQSLTEAAWCGNGGIFTRAEFVALRDALIGRKLAAWNNPTCTARGWGLTRSGLAAFEYLAGPPTPNSESEVKMQGVF
jgi:hypothetical protein